MLLVLLTAAPASADIITFYGSATEPVTRALLSAWAAFELTGSTLTITLANTSSADVTQPREVLTGVFFDTTTTLTPSSASLGASRVYYTPSILNDVGEGWQFKSGISANGKTSGVSAAGLGVFGPDGNFYNYPHSGVNLGGLDYGILSAEDDPGTGNGGVTGAGPLIKNSIVFTLTAANGFNLSELGDSVVFQYGTALSPIETAVPGVTPAVPEPATMLLFGSGLIGLAEIVRRRFKKKKQF